MFDPLDAEEITSVVAAARATDRLGEGAWFATVALDEQPGTDAARLGAPEDADPPPRVARLSIVNGPEAALVEARIDCATGEIVAWEECDDVRPALGMGECLIAMAALYESADFRAALSIRGIGDIDEVQIDPWPAGAFADDHADGRRVARCLCYHRPTKASNPYARPIEGLTPLVDMATGEILDIGDRRVVPVPTEDGSYYPEDQPHLRDDLRPLDIVQSEGPSFSIDGHVLSWQRWQIHVSLDAIEGLVLRDISYADGPRVRPVLRRASIAEMVVPYGDPEPSQAFKSAFDVGEWGLGRMANSLTLGCDCLGEIAYLDAVIPDEHGRPITIPNAICIHEEDFGILWKHVELHTGRTEVRRNRRLVVSSIATIGNYEYGFYWYFSTDGTIGHETKLTGIMSPKGVADGEESPYATLLAPGVAAAVHQHLFCARLDVCVDGPRNEVFEVDVVREPPGKDNPLGNAFRPVATRLETEAAAQRDIDVAKSRTWRIVNPEVHNRLGAPTGYQLSPGASPTLLSDPSSSVWARAGFARHNVWVTPATDGQLRPAGDHPNQHPGDGLVAWTAADRPITNTPIVLWHTFGITHIPRPEQWPVMPVDVCGFQLVPFGFFDANPAMDLPPSAHGDHCH